MINPWLTSAKILPNHYFQFLLGTAAVLKNNGYPFSSFMAEREVGWGEGRGGQKRSVMGNAKAVNAAEIGLSKCQFSLLHSRSGCLADLVPVTLWHEIFAGYNFCDFSSDPQK